MFCFCYCSSVLNTVHRFLLLCLWKAFLYPCYCSCGRLFCILASVAVEGFSVSLLLWLWKAFLYPCYCSCGRLFCILATVAVEGFSVSLLL